MVVLPTDAGWRVYRIKTRSSKYHLALRDGIRGQRPCAILRGYSHGRSIDVTDSAPEVGNRPLFSIPPEKWIGEVVCVGTVQTSSVVSVEEELDLAIVRDITIDRAVQAPPRPPYPGDFVEYLEVCSSLLRKVHQKTELERDLATDPKMLNRFKIALGECALNVEGLREQFGPK